MNTPLPGSSLSAFRRWKNAAPGFDAILRACVFAALAWALGTAASHAPGVHGGVVFAIVFWALIAAVIVRRLMAPPLAAHEAASAAASGAELSQRAQQKLAAEMAAAASWMAGLRFLWTAAKWLCALALALWLPKFGLALLAAYLIWRGWKRFMAARRRRIWERAAQRAPGDAASRAGQVRRPLRARILLALDAVLLWPLMAPVKLLAWSLTLLLQVLARMFRALDVVLSERTVLACLMLPPLAIAWGLRRLGSDALLIAVLWCTAFVAAAGVVFLKP